MICENCGINHNGDYGSGRFCSPKCSRGFSTKAKRLEINEKLSNVITSKIVNGEKVGFCKIKDSAKIILPKTKKEKPLIIYSTCEKCNSPVYKIGRRTCSRECLKQLRSEIVRNSNFSKGGYREGSGRGKKTWYNSPIAGRIYLQSTWELKYAEYLDSQGINWKRNTKRFTYLNENIEHYYVPDFYLIDSDEYIEVKGWERPDDKLKWKAFPHSLKVLFREDLIKLGIAIK
jgi:hypothetical protein